MRDRKHVWQCQQLVDGTWVDRLKKPYPRRSAVNEKAYCYNNGIATLQDLRVVDIDSETYRGTENQHQLKEDLNMTTIETRHIQATIDFIESRLARLQNEADQWEHQTHLNGWYAGRLDAFEDIAGWLKKDLELWGDK